MGEEVPTTLFVFAFVAGGQCIPFSIFKRKQMNAWLLRESNINIIAAVNMIKLDEAVRKDSINSTHNLSVFLMSLLLNNMLMRFKA
ncbi:unnamed protein product [Euphydryas editha]|uniref:Uncharacterized protein n=1 Tax=Euphydryas editha TaxID=104508 RepID=A0AAU9UN86_EUPED|nr:unnamed protein product [Euphydryas editha]